jgi:hypothetical protein
LNSEGQLLPTKEQNKKSVSWGDTESRDNIEMIIDDEPEETIFSKFKKVSTASPNINLNELKEEMKILNSKLDKIIDLLSGK